MGKIKQEIESISRDFNVLIPEIYHSYKLENEIDREEID
jgi:hypothetical protein